MPRIDDGQFCSEEHREAYLGARDSERASRAKNREGKLTRTRQQIDSPEPPTAPYFPDPGLPEAVPGPTAFLRCTPEDFPLGVVAPSSAMPAARPDAPGAVAMPTLQARSRVVSSRVSFVPPVCNSRPQLPRIGSPMPSSMLKQVNRPSGLLEALSGPRDLTRYNVTRWTVLALCFVGIAMGTRFVLSGHAEPEVASAKQMPVAAFEDFSAGLDRWDGAPSGPNQWTLLAARGAVPHALALFKPSTGIADYRLEFTADIEKNGLSWAIRATDPKNYQALQISQRKTGAETQLWLTRYTVTAGKEGPRTDLPLKIQFPAQPIWLVRMEVVGESCTLWVENQIANAWEETAVPNSSVGFFASKGDQFVLKRVRITPE